MVDDFDDNEEKIEVNKALALFSEQDKASIQNLAEHAPRDKVAFFCYFLRGDVDVIQHCVDKNVDIYASLADLLVAYELKVKKKHKHKSKDKGGLLDGWGWKRVFIKVICDDRGITSAELGCNPLIIRRGATSGSDSKNWLWSANIFFEYVERVRTRVQEERNKEDGI